MKIERVPVASTSKKHSISRQFSPLYFQLPVPFISNYACHFKVHKFGSMIIFCLYSLRQITADFFYLTVAKNFKDKMKKCYFIRPILTAEQSEHHPLN